MPKKQRRGYIVKRDASWQVRYYDENGARRSQSGFQTKTEAEDWMSRKAEEVAALRRGDLLAPDERPATIDTLLDLFLEKHGRTVDPATEYALRSRLRKARAEFGTRHPDSLRRVEVEDWRQSLPPGSRHGVFRAFRQALTWGELRGYVERNASTGIKNPKRQRHERRPVVPFESWDEVRQLAAELDPRFAAIPIVAVGTGLRPEELFGLHRADVDRQAGVLRVERRYTQRTLKQGGKTAGSVRAVPLRAVVLVAIDSMPRRIDTEILFPAARGGYIESEKLRYRVWTPAFKAAGLDHRRLYDCRHTFATWAIEQGIELWYLARIMGTSTTQLEDTYARWLQRTDDRLRAAFDAYDSGAIPGLNVREGARMVERSEGVKPAL
jgi:integrase